MNSTAPVLFESSATAAVLCDPANADWLTTLARLQGPIWETFRRRYHVALSWFRRLPKRPRTVDPVVEIFESGRGEAARALLAEVYSGGPAQTAMFVPVEPGVELLRDLPSCLADFSVAPPPLSTVLEGAGRPPIDGLCLLRAFLGVLAMGLDDTLENVNGQLRANPTFAGQCGFQGPDACKEPGELTSRALPSLSLLGEFDTVMTHFGLWHQEQLRRVRDNIKSGALKLDGLLAFDTSHVEAASACSSATPHPTPEEPEPRSRKVGHLQKRCDCGKAAWEDCPHPWEQSDPGAAVVVKGPTRKYWAHKISIAATGGGIPVSVRALCYAATSDGKTLMPHLAVLRDDLPEVLDATRAALVDAAYIGNQDAVRDEYGLVLLTGLVGRKAPARLEGRYPGISRFTPSGVPICRSGHSFVLRGRDIKEERFIWQAPDAQDGAAVCSGCPLAAACLISGGKRRHLRVGRQDFPQIDWEHPQHLASHQADYAHRTGVERAIKRIKVDLGGEDLSRRGASRVQAHIDRRMLLLHLLLAADEFT